MLRCGLGMQQCAMHNVTIQKATFFELGVYSMFCTIALIAWPSHMKHICKHFSSLKYRTMTTYR